MTQSNNLALLVYLLAGVSQRKQTLAMNSEMTIIGFPAVTTPISCTKLGCLSFLNTEPQIFHV
jgi:hypothetical protein